MIIKIRTTDGNIFNITNKNILSSKYQADVSDDNEIILGFASASSFNFSIKNLDNLYENTNFIDSKIELWNDEETIRKGIFNLSKITKRKQIINFETIDNMVKFDQKFKGATFPILVLDLIKALCYQCEVDIGSSINSNLVNSNILIKTYDNFIGKNCREILQLVCEITGTYAIIDENGALQLKWFDFNTIKKEITYSELHDFEIEEINSQINGIEVYIEDVKYLYNSGGTYNFYLSDDNPFFLDSEESLREGFLKNIFDKQLKDMNYYSFNLTTRINYNLNVGDVIKVQNDKGIYYTGIITNIEYNNDSNMVINSAGENRDREYNLTSSGNKTREQNVLFSENNNYRTITVYPDIYQVVNSFNIENVNLRSQAFINYLCEFTCSEGEYIIDFEFYINDVNVKTIKFQGTGTIGEFNAGFKLPLDGLTDINALVVRCNSTSGTILIEKMKSTVSLITANCNPDSAGNSSEQILTDKLSRMNYTPYHKKGNTFFIIKELKDAYNVLLQDENINNLNDIFTGVNIMNTGDYISIVDNNINININSN